MTAWNELPRGPPDLLKVCERIIFPVFKPPLTEGDVSRVRLDYFTPPQLKERRQAVSKAPARRTRWFQRARRLGIAESCSPKTW